MPMIIRSNYKPFFPGISGKEEGKGMVVMPMNDIEFRLPELPQHLKGDVIGIAGREAPESPDQDTIYPLRFGQFTGRIGGKHGDLMLVSQPLAYVSHVLLHSADGGEVSGAYLEYFHRHNPPHLFTYPYINPRPTLMMVVAKKESCFISSLEFDEKIALTLRGMYVKSKSLR